MITEFSTSMQTSKFVVNVAMRCYAFKSCIMYLYLIKSKSIRFKAKISLGVCSQTLSSINYSEIKKNCDVPCVTLAETSRSHLSEINVGAM